MAHKRQTIPGSNPLTQWPDMLDDYIPKLLELDPLQFWKEPFDIQETFLDDVRKIVKRLEEKDRTLTMKVMNAVFLTGLQSGSQKFLLKSIQLLKELHQSKALTQNDLTILNQFVPDSVERLIKSVAEQQCPHRIQYENIYSAFSIQESLSASEGSNGFFTTTDGTYFYVGNQKINSECRLTKVGTGNGGTTQGKIYLDRTIKNEGKGMTFCKGKIYLKKKAITEFGVLVIVNPETFEIEGEVVLHPEEIISGTKHTVINKNFTILNFNGQIGTVMAKLVEKDQDVKENWKEAYDILIAIAREKEVELQKQDEERRKQGDLAAKQAPPIFEEEDNSEEEDE